MTATTTTAPPTLWGGNREQKGQGQCKSGPTDSQHYDKTTHLHHCLTLPSATTAIHVAVTITLTAGDSTATCSTGTTHQHYKSGPTDLQHYDKTTHPCHCLTLPSATTAIHVAVTITLTAGDSTATCGTGTTHQHYKSGPTDLQHYDKTTHPCHCLTLPSAITATHVAITITLTTGDSTATYGTENNSPTCRH